MIHDVTDVVNVMLSVILCRVSLCCVPFNLRDVMLNVVMLSFNSLCDVILKVVMLSVIHPRFRYAECRFTECLLC
jgi:hypothetical protein